MTMVLDRDLAPLHRYVQSKKRPDAPFTRAIAKKWRADPEHYGFPEGTFIKIGRLVYIDRAKFETAVEAMNQELR